MEINDVKSKGEEQMELPPGFRFHPTDEELITHYLSKKVFNANFSAVAIGEVDLNKCEPWDLPWRAKMGEKEWYFFCVRDRKYPTGLRTNRATESGYWKATGKDKDIFESNKSLIGMKKTLVFYKGRAPKGEKTDWIMHEYRLEGKYSIYNLPKTASKNEWVICRVFKKNGISSSCLGGGKKAYIMANPLHQAPDALTERASKSADAEARVTCFSNINAMEEDRNQHGAHEKSIYNPSLNPLAEDYATNSYLLRNMQPQYCYPNTINGSLMQLLQSDIVHGIESFCKTENDQMLISNITTSQGTGITTADIYDS